MVENHEGDKSCAESPERVSHLWGEYVCCLPSKMTYPERRARRLRKQAKCRTVGIRSIALLNEAAGAAGHCLGVGAEGCIVVVFENRWGSGDAGHCSLRPL